MKVYLIAAAVTFLSVSGVAHAERTPGYFETHSGGEGVKAVKDGYFFYKDSAPAAVEEPPITKAAEAPEKRPEPEVRKFSGHVPWDEVYSMHPDLFQELIEDTGKWAIQNPAENSRMDNYITLQYVALDRADRFEKAWKESLNRNPVLNVSAQRAPSRAATAIELSTRQNDFDGYVREMRETMGIIVFSKKGCPYCDKQRTIMRDLAEKWRWDNIIEMDIDEHPDAAAEYSVSIVPDIFLVANLPDGEITRRRLSTGLTSQNDLVRGLLDAYSIWFKGRPYQPERQDSADRAYQEYFTTLQKGAERSTTVNDVTGKTGLATKQ